nr:hypothetical protein [Candidatus Sigynarchaeota archaeon]
MITCPHGYLDISTCPECSKTTNVKPLIRANTTAFTEIELNRRPMTTTEDGSPNFQHDGTTRELPIESITIKRLSIEDRADAMVPSNSTHLHDRLNQILSKGTELNMLDEAVEKRVREVVKRETNPRGKLE